MDGRSEDKRNVIIGGDFTARTGRGGGGIERERDWEREIERSRKSKDKKMVRKGRRLVGYIEKKGWEIYNGNMKGDAKREFTFTGRKKNMVIDYIIS